MSASAAVVRVELEYRLGNVPEDDAQEWIMIHLKEDEGLDTTHITLIHDEENHTIVLEAEAGTPFADLVQSWNGSPKFYGNMCLQEL